MDRVRRWLGAVPGRDGLERRQAYLLFAGKELAGFIEKPFSTQALADAIERVLGPRGPREA